MGKTKDKTINETVNKTGKLPQKLSTAAFVRRLPFELSAEQKELIDAIYNPDKKIIFVNSVAGSGKTQMAAVAACAMVEFGMYEKINYIFPMVNNQNELGLLPGTIEEKTFPFYTPIMQALEVLQYDVNRVIKQLNQTSTKEGSFIDCMPHTFLRGVNFKKSVVIIDETENIYLSELKKILTRVCDDCKVIVIGHDGQCDLYKNPQNSGFVPYLNWFKDEPYCAVCELTQNFRGVVSRRADQFEDEISLHRKEAVEGKE